MYDVCMYILQVYRKEGVCVHVYTGILKIIFYLLNMFTYRTRNSFTKLQRSYSSNKLNSCEIQLTQCLDACVICHTCTSYVILSSVMYFTRSLKLKVIRSDRGKHFFTTTTTVLYYTAVLHDMY